MAKKTKEYQAFDKKAKQWTTLPSKSEDPGLFDRLVEAGIPIRVLWPNGSFSVIKNKAKAPKKERNGSSAWAREAEAKVKKDKEPKAKAEPKPKTMFDEYGPAMVAST